MSDRVFRIPLPGWSRSLSGRLKRLESGFLLREFLAGSENELVAGSFLEQFARRDGEARTAWHPLVLYGASGVGKSHLARGSVLTWHQLQPESAVTYRLAGDFVRDTSLHRGPASHDDNNHVATPPRDSVAGRAPAQPRIRVADAAGGIFVLEHLEHLEHQQRAQEKLIRLLDHIADAGGWAVCTARVPPARIAGLLPALSSRLEEGLVLRVDRPGETTRAALVDELAAQHGLRLTHEAAAQLATPACTARDLNATLARLATSLPAGAASPYEIGRAEAEELLATAKPVAAPTLPAVTAAAARYFALRPGDIRGPSRRRTVALARRISMFLAREHTAHSLTAIGKYYGGRGHSTVSYACSETLRRSNTEGETRAAVTAVREALEL